MSAIFMASSMEMAAFTRKQFSITSPSWSISSKGSSSLSRWSTSLTVLSILPFPSLFSDTRSTSRTVISLSLSDTFTSVAGMTISARNPFSEPAVICGILIWQPLVMPFLDQQFPKVFLIMTPSKGFQVQCLTQMLVLRATTLISPPRASANASSTVSSFSTQQKLPSFILEMSSSSFSSWSFPNPKVEMLKVSSERLSLAIDWATLVAAPPSSPSVSKKILLTGLASFLPLRTSKARDIPALMLVPPASLMMLI